MDGLKATAEAYYQALLSRRPRGPAWAEDDGVLAALSEELARCHNRALDTINEADHRQTYEMLQAWERAGGLPDQCTSGAETVTERQSRLSQKITGRGGQSRAFFIIVAEKLGCPGARITEFRPFACTSVCEDSLDTDPWRFVWRLDVPHSTPMTEMTTGSVCTDFIRVWGDTALECVITRLKPAHTHVLFSYGKESS
jgi:uncharacterized protein YmfQ (DUF2313 family)